VIFDFVKDFTKLILIGMLVFFLFQRYIRWRRPNLSAVLEKQRVYISMILAALLVAIKVSEDALTGESGPMDKAILMGIHHHMPSSWTPFFAMVTWGGSFDFLVPLLAVSSLAFVSFKKWSQVALLLSSAACGGVVIYLLKTITARDRPALWETRWYWGTSFPSGHTLETACCATALTFCLSRLWPAQAKFFRGAAVLWVLLVGSSRLVLGVHWPTDVLVAACVGMLIPVSMQFLFVVLKRRAANSATGLAKG
jgi:undecaprenyl-diphosphatase